MLSLFKFNQTRVTILALVKTAAIMTATLIFNTCAYAEAPTIAGDVNIAVETEEVTNAAEGDDASAQVIVGSFLGAGSEGDLDIVVSTGTISNMAEGDGACNQVVIGSVVGTVGCLGVD